MMLRAKIQTADARSRLNLQGPFAVVTPHRPCHVDERDRLAELIGALVAITNSGGHESPAEAADTAGGCAGSARRPLWPF
jgi:hypothetical protein